MPEKIMRPAEAGPAGEVSEVGREILDAQWYAEFVEIGAFEAYDYFKDGKKSTEQPEKSRRQVSKESFLADESHQSNPELQYPELSEEWIKDREVKLLDLKRRIISTEQNPVVRQVYRWRINEKIAELRLMRAALQNKADAMAVYSDFVYGSPKKDIFAFTWNTSVESLLRQAEASENEAAKKLVQELHGLVQKPETSNTEYTPILPEQSLIDAAAAETRKGLGEAIDIQLPEGAETFSDTEIQALFQRAIHSLGIEGWIVTIEKGKASISASQEKRQVQIPEGRTDTLQKIIGLIAHEIGTHALRRHNGERTKLQLLGLGLDRYEGGEEGVATMREHVLKGAVSDFAGAGLYLVAGLARGLDGTDPSSKRDFRQTFEVLQRVEMLRELLKGTVEGKAKELADTRAWDQCIRMFRGTDCKTPGAIFTKDIIYREGNIGVWQLMSQDQDAMMRFSIGKFDPASPRHQKIIEYVTLASQTEITDTDLARMQAIEAEMDASSPLRQAA